MKKTKIIPSDYKTKAEAVLAMLNEGMTSGEIRKHMDVSYSYIHHLRGQMAHKAEEAAQPLELTQEMQVKPETDDITGVLEERGTRYGPFLSHAAITQRLKTVAHQFANERGTKLVVDQAEALDMIFHKIGRILNGDPNYADSWVDIAGYAKLVADRLEGKVR
jgi:DNA-binding transcriptional regulator LsrR (DeoR family)